jgi:DNA-binding NarL/FixJ family response regulator
MAPIRLALLEGDPEVRELLHGYLCEQPEFECVLVAASVEHLLAKLPTLPHSPQVLLLDSNLTGAAALPLLRQQLPQTAIVLQTVFDDADRIYQALCQGASGYLLKNTPLAELKTAVHDVAQGGAPMSRAVARKVLAHFRAQPGGLAPHERAVVQAIVEGLSEPQVVARLGISPEAVRASSRLIYSKLATSTPARLPARQGVGQR